MGSREAKKEKKLRVQDKEKQREAAQASKAPTEKSIDEILKVGHATPHPHPASFLSCLSADFRSSKSKRSPWPRKRYGVVGKRSCYRIGTCSRQPQHHNHHHQHHNYHHHHHHLNTAMHRP